jgi:hypothetical protein
MKVVLRLIIQCSLKPTHNVVSKKSKLTNIMNQGIFPLLPHSHEARETASINIKFLGINVPHQNKTKKRVEFGIL